VLLAPLLDGAYITAAYSPLARQKLAVSNSEFSGKLAAEHMKVRRIMIVPEDHDVKRTNPSNRRHAPQL
jgi:hypothetical protein